MWTEDKNSEGIPELEFRRKPLAEDLIIYLPNSDSFTVTGRTINKNVETRSTSRDNTK